MDDHELFPVQQFYEALMSSTGLEQKLQPILKQIKTKNMEIVYKCIVHIHQILNSKLEPPLMKLNALNCTKILFSTCEYSVILLIEVYLLPIIFEIAAYRSTKKSQQSLSLYFIQRGAQPTKQVKRLGFNYVILAIQFIYVTSQIKMYRVLQNQQLEEESNFKKIGKALKMRGVPQISTFNFFNSTYVEQTRRIYLDKLSAFNPQKLIDYLSDLLFDQLIDGRELQLDSKRLIMFGDVYIISPLVNKIQQELNQIDGNFQTKRKVISLLFQLVHFGYIQAILVLNSSDFLMEISQEIQKVQGDKDMDEGRLIYQQINDNPKNKKNFYLQFLKCIQTWQHAVPLNQNNEQSDPKRIYQYLKYQKKFKFPQNINKHKYKSQMQIYLRQNSQRNQKVLQLIDSRQTVSTKSKYRISSLQDQSNIKQKKKKSSLEFEELQEIIIDAMKILEVIGYSQKKYVKQMAKLLNFKASWHQNIQSVKKTTNQNSEPFNIDMLISQGQIVYQQIIQLQKVYDQFKNKTINFQQAQQKINDLLNKFQEQINGPSQISVSAKSKNTIFTNRRDLRSKISQKVRNDKSFSDHSNVSQSKSAKSNNLKINRTRNLNQSKKMIETSKPSKNNIFLQQFEKVNQTFAADTYEKKTKNLKNKQEKQTSKQINLEIEQKKTKEKTQRLNNARNQISFDSYGLGYQKSNKGQKVTATFIPVKDQTEVNQSFNLNQKIKPNNDQKVIYNKIEKEISKKQKKSKIQQFGDSFEVQSSLRQPNSKVHQKADSFLLNINSSQSKMKQEIESGVKKSSVKGSKQQRIFQIQSKIKGQHKNSLIKRILSNDKTAPNKINFSQSSDDDIQNKRKMQVVQNKKISKFVSFNNGNNFSGYFNQKSIQQYGFAQNNRQKNKLKEKKYNERQNQILQSQESFRKQLNSPKVMSSQQISKIKQKGEQSFQNFDDFQILKNEYKQSRKNSKEVGNQSQVSEVMNVDLTQKIKVQQSFQMLESHYKTKQIEEQKFKKKSKGQQLKFGQIVQVNKQIIHGRNNCLSPINNRQQDHQKTRMQKLFDFKNGIQMKKKNNDKNLMQVLSQRSTKKCIEHYLIQKQKAKLIKNLNLRIQNLQNQQKTLKTKLSRKDQELRSMSFKNYSQKNKMKFVTQNSRQISLQDSSKLDFNSFRDNSTSNNNSLYYKLNGNGNNATQKYFYKFQSQQNLPKQNIIDLSIYDKCFDQLNSNTLKKNCLKNKSLLVSNQQIQIGCMSLKKDQVINFTLFITPKAYSINNLKVEPIADQNLTVSIFPASLYSIKQKKQQTFHIKVVVQNVPYKLPRIIMQYQIIMNQNAKNKTKRPQIKQKTQLVLPCTFNKLCLYETINSNDFIEMFSSGQNPFLSIKAAQKFKINSKLFKDQKIKQYFPFLCFIKKRQSTSSGKISCTYGFEANYNGNIFLIMLIIQEGRYAKIESKNMTGSVKNQNYIKKVTVFMKENSFSILKGSSFQSHLKLIPLNLQQFEIIYLFILCIVQYYY